MKGSDPIPEKDWKVLRSLKDAALERYFEGVLAEVAACAAGDGGTAKERYHALWKLLEERAELIEVAFDDHRRSTAHMKLLALRGRGLLTEEEFQRFSAETREWVESVLRG